MKLKKMDAIDLLKATTEIQKIASGYCDVFCTNITFEKEANAPKDDTLKSTIYYFNTNGERANLTVCVYEFQQELTFDNLLENLKKSLKNRFPKIP